MRIPGWLCGLMAMGAMAVQAEPQGGWWWNPSESGRGYFLEVQGPRIFFAGYFYQADGRATWLVSNDPMPDPNVYSGRLLSVRGGQSLVGAYKAPSSVTDAGGITLQFSDDSHATLTWPGGTVAIERYAFRNSTDADVPPMTGWWWNPDESGRGFSIEVQGDHMFVGAYMYDASGNPVWYVADGLMESPTRFRQPLLEFANGQTQGGAYRAPSAPRNAGALTIDFTDPESATITLSDEPGIASDREPKQFKSFTVKPQRKEVHINLPVQLTGSFTQTQRFADANGIITITAPSVIWRNKLPSDLSNLDGSVDYEIVQGTANGSITGIIDQGDVDCSVSGSGTHTLQRLEGTVNISAYGRFSGRIYFPITINETACGITIPLTTNVFIPLAGTFNTVMKGAPVSPPPFPGAAGVTSEYNFR